MRGDIRVKGHLQRKGPQDGAIDSVETREIASV